MRQQESIAKTTGQIFKENICTLFNLFNAVIAVVLACVGAWSNLLFIVIIMINTIIGIAQELHAKHLVEKLSLLSMPSAEILRNGKAMHVSIQEVQLDDILILSSGNQICADSVLLSGELEVNESLLTGESDSVLKKAGDTLLSGSSVISGKCEARVVHIGADNYATQIANEVKKGKQTTSELLLSMRKVTRLTGYCIVPVGILLFLEAFFLRDQALDVSVVATSAGLLGMLPKGLVLLISIGLASGIIRLSKQNVLVQDLYSLEMLAHVDVICLDKTGTLTAGTMEVEQVVSLSAWADVPFATIMEQFLAYTDDNNATFQALRSHFSSVKKLNSDWMPISKIPFASDRKWSGMTFQNGISFVIGAPERLSAQPLPEALQQELHAGKRILLAGIIRGEITRETEIPSCIQLLAGIVIVDPIRKGARETVAYFHREGVMIKVISGDNPVTVSAAAVRAGVPDGERYMDMTSVTDDAIPQIVREYAVFGRVTPQQKRLLIHALQADQHTVAMTGDGVNDLLAMKDSDCAISLGEASDSARQVAQVVLLDSDFSKLRQVLAEGRRVVNNVTKSAGVFFIKTIYSVLLCIFCLLGNFPFPFLPVQITLIDLVIEGGPSFFLSFEPNDKRISGRFLSEAVRRALPNALSITVCILAYFTIGVFAGYGLESGQENTLLYLIIGIVSVSAVYKSCYPFTKFRFSLATVMSVGYFLVLFMLHEFWQMELPTEETWIWVLCFGAVALLLERVFAWLLQKFPLFPKKYYKIRA